MSFFSVAVLDVSSMLFFDIIASCDVVFEEVVFEAEVVGTQIIDKGRLLFP